MFRRAPLVWTPRQPVRAGAVFERFLGVERPREEGVNRWLLFRRRFTLDAAPRSARVRIFTDGRHQLFVGGVRVGRGPARADPHHPRFDEHEVATHLGAGENVFAVLVHVYGIDTAWYERARAAWQAVFGDGGLWLEADLEDDGGSRFVGTDTAWRCLETTAWRRDVPRVNFSLGFVEEHDARAMPLGWTEPGFDDAAWDTVRPLEIGGGPPDGGFGGMRVVPFPALRAREIPPLRETPWSPERVVAWYGATPRPELSLERRAFEEPLVPLPAGLVDEPAALLAGGAAVTTVRTSASHDVSFLLDFGRIHAGHPFVELEAQGGEVVEIAVSEGLPGEWDATPPAQPRVDRALAHGSHLLRYVARPGAQRFERFEWSPVRWMQVTVRNAPGGLRLRHVGSLWTRYPAEERGRFRCSDALLTRLWEVGRYTLLQCMHDGWEDCPSREQRQWLGDATVEYLAAQAAFGPSTNPLNAQFLRHAAESQRGDGLTEMFAPGDHRSDALLIPDWTLQWILNAEQHWLHSGDLGVVEEIFPAIERALAWFEAQRGPNGLVADCPHWHFIDWAACGRRGEAAPLNALLVGALRGAARLARALESGRAAERYAVRAAEVARALDARHWDARRGVYVDEVDPATGAQDLRVSQHANAAAILFGVAPRERWGAILARILDPARGAFTAAPPIKPHGDELDPEHGVVLVNTFFSHFLYRALARAERFDAALAEMRRRYGGMLARGATTLWESFEPTASLCHGFSAAPVHQLSAGVLGVLPTSPGFQHFRVSPRLGDLDFAEGVFPTVRGDVELRWERAGAGVAGEVRVPDGCQGELVAPPGLRTRGGARLGPGRHEIAFAP
jgi:hypothetical protein